MTSSVCDLLIGHPVVNLGSLSKYRSGIHSHPLAWPNAEQQNSTGCVWFPKEKKKKKEPSKLIIATRESASCWASLMIVHQYQWFNDAKQTFTQTVEAALRSWSPRPSLAVAWLLRCKAERSANKWQVQWQKNKWQKKILEVQEWLNLTLKMFVELLRSRSELIRSTNKCVALRKSKTHRIVVLDGSLHPCNHTPTYALGEFFAGMKRPAIASKESQKRSKGSEEGRVVRSSRSSRCRKERGGGDASRQNCFP